MTIRVAKKQNSMVLEANAWHHRSDAISSILAFLGIGGQMLGIPYLDAIAGIAVAGIIIQAGYPLIKESAYELVDRNTFPDIFSVVECAPLIFSIQC
jgi:divalent metal cation (Fe/Co/Zn/Cd) transporter